MYLFCPAEGGNIPLCWLLPVTASWYQYTQSTC